MADAAEPGGSAMPLGSTSTDMSDNVRKRGIEDVTASPESDNHTEERKKPKSQETNPDASNLLSPEENCVSCAASGPSSLMIKCQLCDDFYHMQCLGVVIDKYAAAIEMTNLLGWSCKECRNDHRKSMIKLKEDLSSMQQQLDAMLARSLATAEGTTGGVTADRYHADYPAAVFAKANITTDDNTASIKPEITYASVVKAIGQVVSDTTRRKRNIIISGITETDTIQDIDIVNDLLGSVLRMETRDKIVMMKRIGKINSENEMQARRLLVVFDSETVAAEILSRAHLLRDVVDPESNERIYINRDLSPDESKAAFERRVQRRQQQHDKPSVTLSADREPQRSSKVYYRSAAYKPTAQAENNHPSARQDYRGGWARGGPTWWKPSRDEGGRGEGGRGSGRWGGRGAAWRREGGGASQGEESRVGARQSEPAPGQATAQVQASAEGTTPTTTI